MKVLSMSLAIGLLSGLAYADDISLGEPGYARMEERVVRPARYQSP
jgi:hypothetical protein